jgi:7,8-didemethyl-8-hydroxy-5-deazariboflavin synthase CofH subunit
VTVTFLRVRPTQTINALQAATRRKEGTTALEVDDLDAAQVGAAAETMMLPVSVGLGSAEPVGWVVSAADALTLVKRGVAGWRITVVDCDHHDAVLDAVARSRAAYLRTGRSHVEAAVERMDRPGIDVVVSVFVDDVEQAVAAVEAGAGDLLLRDWDVERIGQLRTALGSNRLVERCALPLGVEIDEARRLLPSPLFTAWCAQIDASGAARPRYSWSPGKDEHPPVPAGRFSAEWLDAAWVQGSAPAQLAGAGELAPILERSLAGTPPTRDEIEILFRARGDQVDAVAWTADRLRHRAVGDTVTYVVNRNINYTNMCYFRCGFCAFSKGPRSLNLRGDPYLMGVPEIVAWSKEAWDKGATEVTLQGGIHPEFTGDFYVGVVEAIKAALPDMHIHGFTPLEVWQGAETLGVPVETFLTRLRDAGLGTLPGTAAEILDDDVREHLCPDKIRTSQWADVMIKAHELGMGSTATIMFGHIDHPRAWANHLEVIRAIQRRTGGFTEMVPLSFVHMGSPIFLQGKARPGPTWDEVVLIHAVSRIAFDGLIDNIQGSWVKLGLDGAARLLDAGCNDVGGTLMGEIITRSAGAAHGQEMTPAEFEEAIVAAGRHPARRNTVYEPVMEISEPAE